MGPGPGPEGPSRNDCGVFPNPAGASLAVANSCLLLWTRALRPPVHSHVSLRYFIALRSLAPSGAPQPVQASQPGLAGNWPSSNPSVSLLPLVMSRNAPPGPIVS